MDHHSHVTAFYQRTFSILCDNVKFLAMFPEYNTIKYPRDFYSELEFIRGKLQELVDLENKNVSLFNDDMNSSYVISKNEYYND